MKRKNPIPLESVDAEEAVLSAMMMSASAIEAVSHTLSADAFTDDQNRNIYGVIRSLHSAGTKVDPITLNEELRRRGEDESIRDHVIYLIDVVPTDANIEHHAKVITEMARRRSLLKLLSDVDTKLRTGDGEIEDLAQEIQKRVLPYAVASDGKGYRSMQDILAETLDLLQQRGDSINAGVIPGVTTGYPEIDDRIVGFRPGELVGVFAGPKQGKTTLTLCMAIHNVLNGDGAGFVCAEMTAHSLAERCISAVGRIETRETARGMTDAAIRERMMAAAQMIYQKNNFWVDDEAFPELGDVIARGLHLKSQNPNLKLLIVDYLQLITNKMPGRTEATELSEICKGLKGLAKRAELTIIAPGQTNYKEVDARTNPKPTLRDVQGTSGPAQTFDFTALASRPNMNNPTLEDTLNVEFAASRRTESFEVQFGWAGKYMRVESHRAIQFARRSN